MPCFMSNHCKKILKDGEKLIDVLPDEEKVDFAAAILKPLTLSWHGGSCHTPSITEGRPGPSEIAEMSKSLVFVQTILRVGFVRGTAHHKQFPFP